MKSIYKLSSIFLLIISCFANDFDFKTKQKSTTLPPCKACTVLTESFKKGIEQTARMKHDGGDADWEEKKLGSYKTSEIRLVEIQESLCTDISRGTDQCHTLAGDNEHLIEDWWFNHQNEHPDMYDWLCIDQLKVCCPPNHYGQHCTPCPDCSGNGKCKGNGTRKGNGECACDSGYIGDNCNKCAIGYYLAYEDQEKILCSQCYKSCDENGCSGSGPKNCLACKNGWTLQPEHGCVDINECVNLPNPCNENNEFCVNNEGSFTCLDCDKSCIGCTGDGPDLCVKCADGYDLRDGKCTDLTNEKREQYVTFTRYLTYLGLCITFCVIFQNSTTIASIVGVAVAIYISASEYWLNTSPSAVPSPQIDTKQLEDMIKNSL